MYKCEILADSLSPQGDRLTTFKITYPRIIHAEMCRHRMLSRNTASSRAIPFEKMVKDVQENPFIPIAWQKKHKGMQGNEYLTDPMDIERARHRWLLAKDNAIEQAKVLYEGVEVTKQLCNRLLEPFVWTTELITTGEEGLMNFFELRCPKYQTPVSQTVEPQHSWKDLLNVHGNPINEKLIIDNKDNWTFKMQHNLSQAEIHIQKIAEMMWDCYNESTPKQLQAGEWHIPFEDRFNFTPDRGYYSGNTYINGILVDNKELRDKLKVATARCARLSYETLGDNPKIDYEADIKLHDRLLESKHLSCFEHCAKAMSDEEYDTFIKGILSLSEIGTDIAYYEKDRDQKDNLGWCNNFKGFIQYRYLVENEKIN